MKNVAAKDCPDCKAKDCADHAENPIPYVSRKLCTHSPVAYNSCTACLAESYEEKIAGIKKELEEERRKTFYLDNNYQCPNCKCVFTGRDSTYEIGDSGDYAAACPFCGIDLAGEDGDEIGWEEAMLAASDEIIRLRKLYEPKSLEPLEP